MDREGYRGSITVFLSISCILFLALICTAVESARVQGARAQTANITGMGNFSLFSEFENKLLEKYEIFSLDGTYGKGAFQIQKVNEKLEKYLSGNANPKKDLLSGLCADPWRLSLTECEVERYALLTDENGEPFYQQAVSYMKSNLGAIAIEKLVSSVQEADQIKEKQKQYEEAQERNDDRILQLEDQKQEKIEAMESEAAAIVEAGGTAVVETEPPGNPLKEIAKLRRKSVLEIVTWDQDISNKKIKLSGLPSRGGSQKGTMELENEHDGTISDLLFREYLLMHFPNFTEEQTGEVLEYQTEYLLGGKATDEGNLKYVVNRLLLMREGMNYLYCLQNPQMNAQAQSLAVTFTGFLGIPAVTTATKHALLLAWAYGESLIDVRILLDNGKVPIYKDASSWKLTLENLGKITQVLRSGAEDKGEGLSYKDYLRLLLHLGSVNKQKLRALDLIQLELRTESETENFRAENCIVAVETVTKWSCSPMFASLPGAVLGMSAQNVEFEQAGSISY